MNKRHTPKLHVKKGHTVKVLAGNYRGKIGTVVRVYPHKGRATVEGINMLTHYLRPTQENPKGGTTKKEAPLHLSNLMVLDPTTKEPTRIGRKRNEAGKLQRYAKKTGNLL